jgi:hypothetical protein
MKKVLAVALLTTGLSAQALSPNEMLVIVGAVKYYNENCAGLSYAGVKQMNKGLKRFDMDETPLAVLEKSPLAISGYQTALRYGCKGTKIEAYKAGFGAYVN